MTSRIAIIDCGTNTFHLLIGEKKEGQFSILFKEKLPVKIGEGGISKGIITPEAEKRAIQTLTNYKEIATQYGVNEIFAFATSAFRNARNSDDIVRKVREKTGIKIKVISGESEAELIFEGIKSAIALDKEPVLVMDIGGGSVEFIIGNDQSIFWSRSYEIGAQRLLDRFHDTEPISKNSLQLLEEYLGTQLDELIKQLKKHQAKTLIGSSGTFDTLSDIYCQKYGIEKSENAVEVPFTLNAFEEIHHKIINSSREERLHIPGMLAMRVDMIVVASALIDFILNNHAFNQIRVSTYAMKEGIMSRIIKNQL
ncbi:MAG: Ppx/GppA phosphatase family protein [Fulvivirga sp.]|nr:Ppx/GppA phosphatase family protein [Fulvivirga sp.]